MRLKSRMCLFGAAVMMFTHIITGCGDAVSRQQCSGCKGLYLDEQIKADQYVHFLKTLTPNNRKLLMLSLCKSNKEKDKKEIMDRRDVDVREILTEANWVSRHWVSYSFCDTDILDYHKTLVWVVEKLDIAQGDVVTKFTTFQLEHLVLNKFFTAAWDRLSKEDRERILRNASKDIDVGKAAGIAAMTGGAATAAILATELVAGSWFYFTVCSQTIVVASAAITGASASTTIAAVSAFCGPVGWCVAGASLVGGGLLVGRADVQRTAAFIIQNHIIKLDIMRKSGVDPKKFLKW